MILVLFTMIAFAGGEKYTPEQKKAAIENYVKSGVMEAPMDSETTSYWYYYSVMGTDDFEVSWLNSSGQTINEIWYNWGRGTKYRYANNVL